jgi:hypothetical protein
LASESWLQKRRAQSAVAAGFSADAVERCAKHIKIISLGMCTPSRGLAQTKEKLKRKSIKQPKSKLIVAGTDNTLG